MYHDIEIDSFKFCFLKDNDESKKCSFGVIGLSSNPKFFINDSFGRRLGLTESELFDIFSKILLKDEIK